MLGREVVGDGLREEDIRVIFAHVEARLGGPDGGGHGDDEVGNGAGVRVHEPEAPLGT